MIDFTLTMIHFKLILIDVNLTMIHLKYIPIIRKSLKQQIASFAMTFAGINTLVQKTPLQRVIARTTKEDVAICSHNTFSVIASGMK